MIHFKIVLVPFNQEQELKNFEMAKTNKLSIKVRLTRSKATKSGAATKKSTKRYKSKFHERSSYESYLRGRLITT